MLFGFSWAQWLTWLLAAFFAVNGVINITGPKAMRDSFAEWGFPGYWHIVNGAILLLTGILLVLPQTRPFGFGLGVLECLAIYITLIRHKAFSHLPPSVVMLIVLGVAWWGLYGLGLPA
jgi:hypothetical protein